MNAPTIIGIDLTREARRELFTKAAVSLCGPDWMAPIARDLEVSLRNVRRWATDRQPIPPGVMIDLARLLRQEGKRLEDLAKTLEAAGTE